MDNPNLPPPLDQSGVQEESTEQEKEQSSTGEEYGCEHYKRRCQIECPQCKTFHDCRLCHDDDILDHELDRFKVTTIRCSICNDIQPTSKTCQNPDCQIEFGNYYCEICHLWADIDPTETQIHHCEECGFCRKSSPDTQTVHCKTCKCCMAEDHECRQDLLSGRCPVCLEDFFHSTQHPTVLQCSHLIHNTCLKSQVENHNYRCPVCQKSIADLTSLWDQYRAFLQAENLPDPYPYWESEIDCQDCHKSSITRFHYQLHECQNCHSFNTQRKRVIQHDPPETPPEPESQIENVD